MESVVITEIDTREDARALVVSRAGQEYRLNSAAFPTREAARFCDGFPFSDGRRTVCLFGAGNSVIVSEILSRLDRHSKLLICEPCHDIYTLFDGRIHDERIILCDYESDRLSFREELIKNIDFYALETMLVCCHPIYDRAFAPEYLSFMKDINENRERLLVNRNTLARFRDSAPKHVLENLYTLEELRLVEDLKSILTPDIPVIIVSAGPSLDKNIELLREAKGHCLIFAVDTAMKYLLARDIYPDLSITIEPIKPIANYSDERCFDIPIVFDSESNPEIIGPHRSARILYNCRDYFKSLIMSIGREVHTDIQSGGSVATAAFAICYELGIRHIILIGQDLAYDGEFTHAGGVESKGINDNIGYDMTDGYYGGQVRTRSDWQGYRRWFEQAISLAEEEHTGIEVIDATEGGALIHGSTVMSLREAVDKYCTIDYDFAAKLQRLPGSFNAGEYKAMMAKHEEAVGHLPQVRECALRASALCEKIVSCGRVTGQEKSELLEAQKRCEGELMYPLIRNYAVTLVADEISTLLGDTSDSLNAVRAQKLGFDAIVTGCDFLTRILCERTQ